MEYQFDSYKIKSDLKILKSLSKELSINLNEKELKNVIRNYLLTKYSLDWLDFENLNKQEIKKLIKSSFKLKLAKI